MSGYDFMYFHYFALGPIPKSLKRALTTDLPTMSPLTSTTFNSTNLVKARKRPHLTSTFELYAQNERQHAAFLRSAAP
jgi:hypothetical protein